MFRSAVLATLIGFGSASHGVACALPPPQCEVRGGQIAVLDGYEGRTVMFSQYDAEGPHYAPTYVLVDCSHRQAVALGDLEEDASAERRDAHLEGRYLMGDELNRPQPRLGRVHRQLKRLGLRSKRFTLMTSHCGCDLPQLPPPPAGCPEW